jgi:protocatechuate 3,4-dioxygenase beta subunit
MSSAPGRTFHGTLFVALRFPTFNVNQHPMKFFPLTAVLLILIEGCTPTPDRNHDVLNASNVHVDTCDSPDAHINCCFVNMAAQPDAAMNITGKNELGNKLVISGRIFRGDGNTPYPNVILYAYHTDANGYYTKKGNETGFQRWHGYLHGWCKTDRNGNYQINTIRPAPYPDNTIPAHIHAAVRLPKNNEAYYLADFVFQDDPLVNDAYRQSVKTMAGAPGIVNLVRQSDGSWSGVRDVILPE